jgi:SMC interacting uncharacterized protein involved in chromosome segregation
LVGAIGWAIPLAREARAMKSVDELRAEARRLRETVSNISDPQLKRELVERALQLSERAEAIERSVEHPDILRANIRRFRSMIEKGIDDIAQKRIVEEMLADAEAMLASLRKEPPP